MGLGTLRRHRQRLLTAALLAGVAHGAPIDPPQPPPAPALLPEDEKLPNNFAAKGILAAAGIETYHQLIAFGDDALAQLSGIDQEKLIKIREARDKYLESAPKE